MKKHQFYLLLRLFGLVSSDDCSDVHVEEKDIENVILLFKKKALLPPEHRLNQYRQFFGQYQTPSIQFDEPLYVSGSPCRISILDSLFSSKDLNIDISCHRASFDFLPNVDEWTNRFKFIGDETKVSFDNNPEIYARIIWTLLKLILLQ